MREKGKSKGRLTDLEQEIMNVVWDIGETTITEVSKNLSTSKKKYAYTTVATMMKILEKKKFLKSQKKEKAHRFSPIITRDQYEGKVIHHIVDNVFQGASANLVMKLLDETNLNQDELKKIRETLESRIEDE